MTSALRIAGLSVPVPRGAALILDDVSFEISAGEALGIVGESGSGKSTLARAILGLVRASTGEVELEQAAGLRRLRQRVALLFQNPANSFNPRFRVAAILGEACRGGRARVTELLRMVGLDPALARAYPHMLSGGQARRVALARALAGDPAVLIADEPTAGLDVSAQGEMLNLLDDRRRQAGTSLVMITHNLGVVRHASDRVAVLYLGRIVEIGPTAQLMAAPQHPYSRALIDAEPKPDPAQRRTAPPVLGEVPSLYARPSGCEFHPRCARATERCRAALPPLGAIAEGWSVRCHHPLGLPE